jgi:hypothetical protein
MNSALIAALITALLVPWLFAVVIILIVSRLRRDKGKRRLDFLSAMGLTVIMGVNTSLSIWLAQHFPHTIDARLWRWDEALHLDPLALIYFMEEHARLWYTMQVIYLALPVVMAIAWSVEQNLTLRRAVAIAGVGGWIFGAVFPAIGPHWYLDGYSYTTRHCIPALECTWALLLALNARPRLRLPLWIYAIALAFAAVLLGEHYLVDLIVALPYAFALQKLATWWPSLVARFRPAAARVATGPA